jgi:hypothetical protein
MNASALLTAAMLSSGTAAFAQSNVDPRPPVSSDAGSTAPALGHTLFEQRNAQK